MFGTLTELTPQVQIRPTAVIRCYEMYKALGYECRITSEHTEGHNFTAMTGIPVTLRVLYNTECTENIPYSIQPLPSSLMLAAVC